MPLLSEYFRIVEIKGYGGAVLHELLYDIAGNFCQENAGSLDYLRTLFALEDEQTAAGSGNVLNATNFNAADQPIEKAENGTGGAIRKMTHGLRA